MPLNPHDTLPIAWDPDTRIGDMLKGLKGLIVGVANARFHSLWLRRQAARVRR